MKEIVLIRNDGMFAVAPFVFEIFEKRINHKVSTTQLPTVVLTYEFLCEINRGLVIIFGVHFLLVCSLDSYRSVGYRRFFVSCSSS